MEIARGKIKTAQKIVIYGPEGIGKSMFISKFPAPLYIDTEGSTNNIDVARLPKPYSWGILMDNVRYVYTHPDICETLAIDTADWAEKLCAEDLCARMQKKGIEDFSYGKGYIYLAEEFGRLLTLLDGVIEQGVNVAFAAHATMRKFEQPDEIGAYDRWEMKLKKQTSPLLKEWADMLLFVNYQTYVIKTDDNKHKVQGGKRVMHTSHHPCWDAKNRHGLEPELDFMYEEIAHCIPIKKSTTIEERKERSVPEAEIPIREQEELAQTNKDIDIPNALSTLMNSNNVTIEELQSVVAYRGYFPEGTPFKNYDPDFVTGVLIGAWPQVYKIIQEMRNKELKEACPF